MSNVTPFASVKKTVTFDRLRWQWAEAVAASDSLSPLAKLIAYVLISQFAHRETADCHPGWEILASAVGSSPRSVRRAVTDLEAAGFLARGPGGYSGKNVALLFRFEGRPLISEFDSKVARNDHQKVAKNGHQKVAKRDHQTAGERWPDLSKKVASSDNPPTPPYKDKPNSNQEDGAQRPRPDLRSEIPITGWQQEAWDHWLTARYQLTLRKLGDGILLRTGLGFDVPFNQPPADAVGARICEKWVDWALSKNSGN